MNRMISRVSTVRIENASCLRALHDTISERSANWSRLVVAIPQFTRAENQRLATRILELHATCGCKSGAAFGLAALVVSVVWSVTHTAPLGVADLVIAVTAVLVGVVIGKLGGKAVARRTLMRELQELAGALSGVARPSPRAEPRSSTLTGPGPARGGRSLEQTRSRRRTAAPFLENDV